MKVVEIFNSIEGEGKRAGLPATFIRLFGCNLRCSYCDSMYAVEGDGFTEMSIDDILRKVEEFDCPIITLTGGEPLIHPDVVSLLDRLCEKHYWINVETNGSIAVPYRPVDESLFYTFDYKTASSNMQHKMNELAFEELKPFDVIKFVVGNDEDLEQALEIGKKYPKPYIYLSPVFGSIDPKQLVEFVLKNRLWNWRVQLQLHKFIWDPSMKGV